jgi:uncharacterized protein YndB with AHSA1/START domain
MMDAVTAHEITITRVLDAPRELVWRSWTDPDHLARWWGARGWSSEPSDVTIDVRSGGTFRVRSVSDDNGAEMTTVGVLRDVVEPERLVIDESSEDAWHESAVSELRLAETGDGRTEMVLRVTVHTTDEARRHAEAGLNSALDRLEEVLS